MRVFLVGMLLLGFTALGFSQNKNGEEKDGLMYDETEGVVLSDVIVTSHNATYLNNVLDDNTPNRARTMAFKVASYDIKESGEFSKDYDLYEVVFRGVGSEDSKVIATYDNGGVIIQTLEKFKGIVLPEVIRNAVFNTYPGWALSDTAYVVSYYNEKKADKKFLVRIKNGKKKKNLKISATGEIF
ncbi:hypothetical protein [Mangrovimonas aestuarii]|uniref:hypothetical protein n=1 Tax=Mangrovimonas aestuarii TaxID=3018443 RepID=UPI0023793394|nr:hypothetical protein [Mangrovimonas aestuarii]